MKRACDRPPGGAQGMVLICALMLMLAAMIIGVAIVRGAVGVLAAARNERDREVAQAAADAALRDAERDIAGTAAPSSASSSARAAQFTAAGAGAFVAGCGRGALDRGLCLATEPPVWQSTDLADAGNPALVAYGRFTGATLGGSAGLLPARVPAYLIERLAPDGAGPEQGSFYRISAIGFGMRASTQVVLQSLYRKPAPPATAGPEAGAGDDPDTAGGTGAAGDPPVAAPPLAAPAPDPASVPTPAPTPAPPLPAGRIGWREIANWSELHARVAE